MRREGGNEMKFSDSGRKNLRGISEAENNKPRVHKTRGKIKKIQATGAEKEVNEGLGGIFSRLTQSNVEPVSGCTEGYSISEPCCCLFSVLTFLRDNPLPVLGAPHTASP